ncbi:hypothetical protein [Massilia sp. TS11]|uniref:hypothetical protein n=1 Tax=Massilia sp. TS11 TaxID=2908003 RepID=UPI001EDC394B|nr:hypothetical protein [Massilia sp. TS11]MCG2585985.1 hypothetical protein [Massilia sp. TS11]
MKIQLKLDDSAQEILDDICGLSGMTYAEAISRQLYSAQAVVSELLALVEMNPALRKAVASLFVCSGPESLEEGLQRIMPRGYKSLAEQFSISVNEEFEAQEAQVC